MNLDETHRFSWDGVSFGVPADWNLAAYHDDGHTMSIRMDDDTSVRLNAEWVRAPNRLDMRKVVKRYEAMSKDLKAIATETHDLSARRPGWGAFLYIMPDKRRLLTAFRTAGTDTLFCFFRVHFGPGGKTAVADFATTLLSGFSVCDRGLIPWECYDISFKLPVEFKLHTSSFVAGRKIMVFDWHRRRLHLVFASLADMILKKSDKTTWAADFLNRYDGINGPTFAAEEGRVVGRRKGFLPSLHFSEIGRRCFRYAVSCRHDEARNMLILAAFHYRKPSDLKMLDGTEFKPESHNHDVEGG